MIEDEDELINAALYGEEEEPETNPYRREIRSFISMAGLKAGNNPIVFTSVWELFKHLFPESHLGKIKFKGVFEEFFPSKRIAVGAVYMLDPIAFNFPLSYSVYTDKRFYPNNKQGSRKYRDYGKSGKDNQEDQKKAEIEAGIEEHIQNAYRSSKNSKK